MDSHLPDLHRINYKADFFPYLPPTSTGYQHPSGEIYITYDDMWQSCSGELNQRMNEYFAKLTRSGQENETCFQEYLDANVEAIWDGDADMIITAHYGPYGGVTIGCNAT